MRFGAIYVADFMVQAVVRAEPGLRDCAIALLEGTAPLRKVVAANDAALRAGIELGMTESQAEDFCAVQVRLRSPVLEKTAHAALMDLGWSVSPRVEDTAADTIVLDLAGLTSLLGSEEIIAEQLIERASLLGLTARVAISSNLETAIHAARGFAGVTLIPAGEEAKALGGLPVSVLVTSDGLSPRAEILETLDSWGVRTCGALAALPVLDLSERLGQEGVRLHEFARGASSRAMVLAEPDVHFEEEMELEDAVPELEPLSFLLGRLLDQLCARLAARALAASTIRVRFELEPVSENNVRSLNDSAPRKAALPTYEKILTLAGAVAKFEDAAEIASVAIAGGAAADGCAENIYDGRSCQAAIRAGGIVSAEFAGSRKNSSLRLRGLQIWWATGMWARRRLRIRIGRMRFRCDGLWRRELCGRDCVQNARRETQDRR